MTTQHVNILGIRGVPGAHGGFETFATRLVPYLQSAGIGVTVYCQDDEAVPGTRREDTWQGAHRIHLTPKRGGPLGTMEFDLMCVRDVIRRPGVDLVLGYNTAVFNLLQKLRGRQVLMNMDGIEWKRAKWSLPARAWFYLNEIIGANLSDRPIADHPRIADHTARRTFRSVEMIPYGADRLDDAPQDAVRALGLEPDRYVISIARVEPENSILELVRASASAHATTGLTGVVLGKLDSDNAYHRAVRAAGGPSVMFPGAIYDPAVVGALRVHCRAYLHGHQVGGTNPSLVEALGAGNAVLAHDNVFNRWTAGADQFYFADEAQAVAALGRIGANDGGLAAARSAARARHAQAFTWETVLKAYETVLRAHLDR